MRTKTLALSAVLGVLGSASAMASNVYSVNSVGYINVTLYPGWNIVTCPLICSPDNTLNTVLNNANNLEGNSPYSGATIYQFVNGTGYGNQEVGNPGSFSGGWAGGGADIALNPGLAVWFYNPNPIDGANMTATFVGTVPQTGAPAVPQLPTGLSQIMYPGWNLVGSMVPIVDDIVTNTSTAFTFSSSGDFVYFYDPTSNGHGGQNAWENQNIFEFSSWNAVEVNAAPNGDPITTNPAEGFWYYNAQGLNAEYWTESFTVNP